MDGRHFYFGLLAENIGRGQISFNVKYTASPHKLTGFSRSLPLGGEAGRSGARSKASILLFVPPSYLRLGKDRYPNKGWLTPVHKHLFLILFVLITCNFLCAQPALTLSPGGALGTTSSTNVIMNLSLSSPAGSEPSALQWTLNFPAGLVTIVTGTPGPAATAAGKTLSCAIDFGTYSCALKGMNSSIISNGIIASFNFALTYPGTSITVNMTGSAGSSSLGATETVFSGVMVSSIACAPGTVAGGDSSACLINLSGPAPSAGATVTLSSSGSATALPSTVTIAAGATSATVPVATSAVSAAQTSLITASYMGMSQNTTLTVVPAAPLSSITCTVPTVSGTQIMSSAGTANCALNLTGTAAASQTYTLASSSTLLTSPSTVVVAPGSSSATFTLNSAALPSVTKSVTLSASGYAVTQNLTFTISVLVTGLSCTPTAIASPNSTSTSCTITLSQTAAAATPVAITNNAGTRISMPASVTVPAGAASVNFSPTVGGADYFVVTAKASLSGLPQSASFTIGMVPANSLTCSPATLTAGQSSVCTFTLVSAAPAGGDRLYILTSSTRLSAPAQATTPGGVTSGTFAVAALTGYSGPVTVTVKASGITATAKISLAVEPRRNGSPSPSTSLPQNLTCSPKLAQAGETVSCQIQLSSSNESGAELAVAASDPSTHVPARVIARPHQSTISFHAWIDPSASTQSVAIQTAAGDSVAEERISVQASNRAGLSVPGKQFATFGKRLTFQVGATAGVLSATELPQGASFDSSTGLFDWTAAESERGLWKIRFSASDAAGRSAEAEVQIQTGSGVPVIESIENAGSHSRDVVCSEGSLATLRGGWLAPGTQLLVNGAPVPALSASPTEVTFACPSGSAGSTFSVAVETAAGKSAPISARLRDSAPGIFTVDGSSNGQAAATILDGSQIAMARNHRYPGQPAQPGDTIRIPVTGLSSSADPNLIGVQIGDIEVAAESVQALEGASGIVTVSATLPQAVRAGDAIPIIVRDRAPDGQISVSQSATIAIEAPRE